MTDTFLNDVDNAVAGNTESMQQISTDVVQQNTEIQQPQPQQTATVADELTAMFDANDVDTIDTGIRKDEPKKEEVKQEANTLEEQVEQTTQKKETLKREKAPITKEKWVDTFLQEDDKGNLIDADGTVIAAAGRSRTVYEKLRKSAREYRDSADKLALQQYQLAQKFQGLYEEYKGLSDKAVDPIQSIVTESGMNEREAVDALNIMKQFKSDPITAVKNILTQMHLNGIDTTQIGANITADPATIRTSIEGLLNEKLNPIQESAQQDLSQRQAQQHVDNFFAQFPDAKPFENVMAQALQKFPNMPLEEIWFNLRKELVKNQEKSQTKIRKRTQKKRTAPRQKITPKPQNVDYGNMSYDQIAQTILKDSS